MATTPDLGSSDTAFIDDFAIDCLLSDTHTFESEVTEFPVESGATISDNIRPKPFTIAMECIVSNTPLEAMSKIRRDDSRTSGGPSDDAYFVLQSIRKDRRLVSLSTSLGNFANMALESLSIPRAGNRGDELRFNATFKQVEVVTNVRGTRVAIPGAAGPTKDTKTLTREEATGHILVDFNLNTWFDVTIHAWRERVLFDAKFPPSATFGFFVVSFARPIEIGLNRTQWIQEQINAQNAGDVDIHSSARLNPRIRKAQGGKTRPSMRRTAFMPSTDKVRMLSPDEYRFV